MVLGKVLFADLHGTEGAVNLNSGQISTLVGSICFSAAGALKAMLQVDIPNLSLAIPVACPGPVGTWAAWAVGQGRGREVYLGRDLEGQVLAGEVLQRGSTEGAELQEPKAVKGKVEGFNDLREGHLPVILWHQDPGRRGAFLGLRETNSDQFTPFRMKGIRVVSSRGDGKSNHAEPLGQQTRAVLEMDRGERIDGHGGLSDQAVRRSAVSHGW
jgi:hypothetical protein